MNISYLKNNIYGCKNLKEGENINSIMKSIEEQEKESFSFFNLKNDENYRFNEINKEIKF